MPERTIQDRLREEYFDLLPEIRRVAWQLEAEIRFHTLPILHKLKHYEQLVVKARVKECESALRTIARKEDEKRKRKAERKTEGEGRIFDPELPTVDSMLSLPDLAGIRVLVFPRDRLIEADEIIRSCPSFGDWTFDPVKDSGGSVLAPKYYGYCPTASKRVRGEYQIVPMLIGHFWEVEHSAIYKPAPSLAGIRRSKEMEELRTGVEQALSRFEEEFGNFVRRES
jgi:ppGpp synthetase/RelA/SpoT-type nucleotidyltranferase